jgi:hypothetical protein
MSTGRSILFLAEKKSPMVKFLQKSIKEINKELYPKWKPRIIKRGQFESFGAQESYIFGAWFFPDGEDLHYFGGDEVFEKKFDKYNEKYKLWLCMGGSNTTFKDKDTGEESVYPIYYFRLLMDKIKNSGLENDIFLVCTTDSGGWNHKTYPPKIRKQWTGKFL